MIPHAIWDIQQLAAACKGILQGTNTHITGVCIDSRRVKIGDMFIALKTDSNDGHHFVQMAVDKGAVCVLVDHLCAVDIPQIVVSDTLQALTDMGIYARNRFTGTVIGVTGSVGKTSVKDMLTTVLSAFGTTQATVGNLNNHLGVPMTWLSIKSDTQYAVIEMGMSASGEIRHLTKITRPHVAIVTMVDVAHRESFATVADITQAKAEIFEGLTGDKIAIYNMDSLHAEILRQKTQDYGHSIYRYGVDTIVSYTPTARGQTAVVTLGNTPYTIHVPALGQHRILNSIAVLQTVQALGLNISRAIEGIATCAPPAGRGMVQQYILHKNKKISVLDDTYNSSPASLIASLQVLVDTPTPHRRIAVLGDMLELGDSSAQYHKNMYDKGIFNCIDTVFLCGQYMYYLYSCIMDKKQVFWKPDIQQLCPLVLGDLRDNDTVLIKGSRGMQMDILIAMLQSQYKD